MKPEDVALAAFLLDVGGIAAAAGGGSNCAAAISAEFVARYTGRTDMADLIREIKNPVRAEARVLAAADKLAMGPAMNGARGPAPSTGLASIFDEKRTLPIMTRTAMAQYEDDELFHPVDGDQPAVDGLSRAWEHLKRDVEGAGPPLLDLETWREILRQHACRIPPIPVSGRGRLDPTASFFDYAQIRAALAHLLCSGQEGPARDILEGKAIEAIPFSLILGDLSGVQKFIYTGSTARAIRALKGRSFFVQYLMEHLARFILEHLKLTPFSELFCGGGRFYLLGPAGVDLSSVKLEIDRRLLAKFHGALSLSLAATDFGPQDLLGRDGAMGEVFKKVNTNLNDDKRRRFQALARENHTGVFGPFGGGFECPVCRASRDEEAAGEAACPTCEEFIRLGSELRRADYLVEGEFSGKDCFTVLDRRYCLLESLDDGDAASYLARADRIVGLNRFEAEKMGRAGHMAVNGRPTLTARVMGVGTPVDPADESVSTFGELARLAEGDAKIAILRADVDDLGLLFQKQETLPRLASLSRTLSDFFEGRVTAILGRKEFWERTYLVYSGGDDLFVCGSWDAVIQAAADVRNEFIRFTSEKCTLSAGIEITQENFPLRHGAELAGRAEDQAKKYERIGKPAARKNAVCLLGQVLPWADLEPVRVLVAAIRDEIHAGGSRSLIRRMYNVWEAYEENRKNLELTGIEPVDLEEAARWHRWRWLLVYGLRNDAKTPEGRERIIKGFTDENLDRYLGLTVRWAELATRRN